MKSLGVYKFFRSIYFVLIEYFRFRPVRFSIRLTWFFKDYYYHKKNKNKTFELSLDNLEIYLSDKLSYTPVSATYFLQDNWAFEKILQQNPKQHFDVGSSVTTVALLAKIIPVTMVDIRPINIQTKGLNFIKGDILNLPFADNSIESISSLCVVEHIGLGRYGDKLNAFGSEQAIKELIRVTKPNGILYLSVPVDSKSCIIFNAHRCFTRDLLLELIDGMEVKEEKYQYGNELISEYSPEKGFGTGLFVLKKQ